MKLLSNMLIVMSSLISSLFAQELISDSHFQNGFQVLAPAHPPVVEGIVQFDTTKTPIWTCGQWGSKSSLAGIDPIIMQNGWYHWENSEKHVFMGPHGAEEYDLLFGVNSYNEYDGVYRQLGESWPHLLVEQRLSSPNTAGPGCPAMDELIKLDFHVEAKLENDSTIIQAGYDTNIHAAQFLIYFTVQNLNLNSSGYGKDYVWLGVQVYDDRNEHLSEYINHDDGTQSLIYSLAYDSVATKSTHTNEWINFDVDLYPYAISALSEAWQRGYLSASQDLADYKLGGMNIGWELPGMNTGEMKIRNLSLVASSEPTDVTDKSNVDLGFNLSQNYPNPFNPSSKIGFSIPKFGKVKLNIYNVLGEIVTELVNKYLDAGYHQYEFNGSNLTTGIYFYKIQSGSFTDIKKMILIK